jgi:hypothetical protein
MSDSPEIQELAELRQQLAEMIAERDKWKRKYYLVKDDFDYQQCCDLRGRAETTLLKLEQQLATRTAERDQFRGIFGEYDELPRTVEQAGLLWNTLKQQLAAVQANCVQLEAKLKYKQPDEPRLSSCGHYDCNEADCYGQ